MDKYLDTDESQFPWLETSWENIENSILLFLSREIILHIGVILTDKNNLVTLIIENPPKEQYKLLVSRQLLDDSMIIYLRTQNESLRQMIMIIAEFEKSIAEGALGRFEPEMKVALIKRLKEKEELLERLIKNLTIVCPQIYIKLQNDK